MATIDARLWALDAGSGRPCADFGEQGVVDLRRGPIDSGYPLGYWAFLTDPDGHQLELSHGQHNVTTS